MPSAFAALENRLSDAIDLQFGEPFTFQPHAAPVPNAKPSPDPTRGARTVVGVFDEPSFVSTEIGAEVRGSSRFSMRKLTLSIDVRQFAGGEGPRRFDRFLRQGTGTLYEVTDVKQDGEGRFKLMLNQVAP